MYVCTLEFLTIFVIPFDFPEPYSAPATHWIHLNLTCWFHRSRVILAFSPFSIVFAHPFHPQPCEDGPTFFLQAFDSILDHGLSGDYIAPAHECPARSLRCHPQHRLLSSKSYCVFFVSRTMVDTLGASVLSLHAQGQH